MIIKFTHDLRTGVEEMDKDHEKLVELLNKVYELLKEGNKEKAEEVFSRELVAWVEHHLAREEKFMEAIGYPDFERHKKAHEGFRRIVFDLLPHVEKGDHEVFREALALAWGWLAGHIGKVDKKYGEFARERGLIE